MHQPRTRRSHHSTMNNKTLIQTAESFDTRAKPSPNSARNQKVLLANTSLWATYDGLTSSYLAAFALALGASNIIVGLLGALPFLASLLTQIPGAELVQHFSRRNLYLLFSTISRLFWIPLFLSPLLFSHPLIMVVLFYLLVKLNESIMDPAFTTLLADVVPEKNRGSFTSQRLRIVGLFGTIALIAGGYFLKQFPEKSITGFALLFGFGTLIGILATLVMTRLREPAYRDHDHHHIKEFFTIKRPLSKFVAFSVVFNFAFMLASPFFTVYMLKNLGMSYQYFGIATAISIFAQQLTSRYIGSLTDRYGDKPIAILGVFGTAFVPLIYLTISTHNIWMVVPAQILSGIVWAAADISRFNLLLDLTQSNKRAIQIAEYNLYANIPLIIAPILGGWMTEHVTLILAGIPLVFAISSILRMLSTALLFSLKEPRNKNEYSATKVLREAIHFHPANGIVHGIHIVRRIAAGLGIK